MVSRPNFVIFIPDQLRADALGAFGNPHVRTPHLDALAARGTRFTNAFVQHPVCVSSRASFLTGWYPHTSGHRSQNHLLRAHEPNLLRILKDAGYHVTWAGRRGDTFAPGVTELSVHEYGFTESPPTSPYRPELATWPGGDLWARLFYFGRISGDNLDQDEAAIRTAEQRLAAIPDTPWVLFVPIIAPHCPFRAPEPWFSMYDRDTMPDPIPPGETEPRYVPALRDLHDLQRVTPQMWREVIATYYGMVSRMDDHLGRVLSAVERTGQADHTVTLFFADHGEYLGDFGLIEKWPSALHPCITQDPLVIAGGGLPEGQVHDGMVELIDVLPTVLELAGIPAPHRHFGRSLLPVLRDPAGEHREYAFTEGGFAIEDEPLLENSPFPYDLKTVLQHQRPDLVGKATAIRDKEWTYIWRLYDPPELYHRATDPNEQHNLAGRPEHSIVEHRLNQSLLRWLIATSDVIPADSDPRMPDVNLAAPQLVWTE